MKALVEERDQEHIIYWMDNCTGQNKNWTLYTAMVIMINSSEIAAQSVTLKYFEAGHTFMAADFVHAGVEKEMKRQPDGNIFDFEEFVSVVARSNGGHMVTRPLVDTDVRQWKAGQSQAKLKEKDRPMLADIKVAKFTRGSKCLMYKLDHADTTMKKLDFLKKNFKIEVPTRAPNVPRGIPSNKKTGIQQNLCPHMPENRRAFWNALHTSDDAEDLIDAQ
jgi:hypothetical protein